MRPRNRLVPTSKNSSVVRRIPDRLQSQYVILVQRRKLMSPRAAKSKREFDPNTFLATIGEGRKVVPFKKKETIFAQGDAADALFYIQSGKVKLTVVSNNGKEATIGILGEKDFFGEGCLAGQPLRMAAATAMTDCELLRIEKNAMMQALHGEHAWSDMFVAYLLTRNIRYEEDLVDQLFNSSEKRLAQNSAAAGSFRQGRRTPDCDPRDQSRDPRRDGRHNPLAG